MLFALVTALLAIISVSFILLSNSVDLVLKLFVNMQLVKKVFLGIIIYLQIINFIV